MKKRLNYYQAAPTMIDALSQLGDSLQSAFPDPKLKALVELRVSQINGCAYCMDMHSTQARKLGERQQRLDCLPAWNEVPFFTAREKAALHWAESVTHVSETHVPDAVYAEASRHFSKGELAQLTLIVALMNAWNRISISFRNTPRVARAS